MGKVLIVVSCWLLVVGCSGPGKPTEQQLNEHKTDVEEWYAKRIEDLKSKDGWLNLAGLFWLNEGMNSFGSDEGNDVVFPAGKIAPKAGYFQVKESIVTLIPSKDVEMKQTVLFHPDSAKPAVVNYGSLEWFIIRRDDKMGVRLRDLESEAVKVFAGIDRYPVDYSWKVKSKFEPAAPGSTINITNVLGQTTAEALIGAYVFELEGKEHRLHATGNGKKLFVVFADATNEKETYPAGRFIYIDRPDSTGMAIIDFNKSYNPPCAFTEFATCPLPPKENFLAASITAGEKNYHYEKQTSSNIQ